MAYTRDFKKDSSRSYNSNKMENSVVVSEVRRVKHPKYGKFVLKTKKYVAHDQKNDCKIGDKVRIMEVKPMSKTKSWMLMQIIERAK